jgi:hypothetical protein
LNHLYSVNNAGSPLTISSGDAVTFGSPASAVFDGSSISQTNTTTFSINQTGHYQILFVGATTTLSASGGLQIVVNGTALASSGALALGGSTIALQTIANVTSAPVTVQVIGTGAGVTLGDGNTASLMITKLN